jgi:hypothetical protein
MSLEADVRWQQQQLDRPHDHALAGSSGVNMKASTTETPPPTVLNAKQRKKRRIEAGTSETVGETVEPMDDEGDEGDDEEALLDAAQLSPERLAYTESEYGLPGTGSQEERAEAAVEALRAQSAKLRKKKNGKISKDAKDRRNMQNAWRRVDSYQAEGGK